MQFNAFNYLSPAIEDMKRLLFPYSTKRWMKLGLISLLAGGAKGGLNMPNINLGSSGGGGNTDSVNKAFDKVTGNAVQGARESFGMWALIIVPILLAVIIFALIIQYINSVFSFILLEALDTKKIGIKKGWHNSKGLGFSYFLFRIVVSLIVIAAIAVAALPIILPIIAQGPAAYFENFNWWSLAWLLPMIALLLIFLLIVSIFMSLVYNFSTVHMYFHRMPAWKSVRATFARIKHAKLAVLVFLAAMLVISIIEAAAAILSFLLMLLPFLILAIPFVLLFWAIVASSGWGVAVIIGMIAVAIMYFLFFIYVFTVLFLPVTVSVRYFSIHNYRALMDSAA